MSESWVSAEREEFSRREYDGLRESIVTMQRRLLAVEPSSGSILEREDSQTSFYPLTYQVRWQLQLAAAHLMALDNLIQSSGLPYVAGYPHPCCDRVGGAGALATTARAYPGARAPVSADRVVGPR